MSQIPYYKQEATGLEAHPATASRARGSVDPPRWSKIALIFGGALEIITYALDVVYGLYSERLAELGESVFAALLMNRGIFGLIGVALLGVGLLGLGAALRSRARRTATAGVGLAIIPPICAAVSLTSFAIGSGPIGPLGALAVLSSLISATLLGIAVLRTAALPRRIGLTLLIVGLVTFPAILLTIPLEAMLPSYAVTNLPFPIWGAVFAYLGLGLLGVSRQTEAGF